MTVPPAHHAPGGGFRNPWPGEPLRGLPDVIRWSIARRRQALAPDPPRGSFPTATPRVAHPRAGAEGGTATWIGHSTVLLQMAGLNVITDPVFSQRASPVPWLGPRRLMDPPLSLAELPPLDLVLLSHNHYDHLDRRAVQYLASHHAAARWIVPLGLGALVHRWGVREVSELDWWQQLETLGVTVTATPARHFSGRGLGDRCRALWCGYALAGAGTRAYFAGDTAYHPEFGEIGARLGPFDLVMLPIGAYDPRWFMKGVHADPEEAVQAYLDLIGSVVPPLPLMLALHWGTFRLTDEPMDQPPQRTLAAWRGCGLDPDRLWVAAFGETRGWARG